MQQSELITATDASITLRKSVSTIRRMAESGELPYAQKLAGPNGAYLFRRGDVERVAAELAAEQAQAATA